MLLCKGLLCLLIINVGCMGEEGKKEEEEELGVTCLGVLGECRLPDFT